MSTVVHTAGPEGDIALELSQLLTKEKAWVGQERLRYALMPPESSIHYSLSVLQLMPLG